MSVKRQSIQPTYDSRDTGPRYHVTVRLNGKTIDFQHPLNDPFVRQTVTITVPGLLRSLLRFRKLTVELIIGGDAGIIEDVLELDANQLGSNCTRRDEFNTSLLKALLQANRLEGPS